MSIASVAKGALAQVNPFDKGATYGTYNNGLSAKPTATPSYVSAPSYQPSNVGIDTSAYDKQIADSNNAIKALQSQLATQPKLPFYDTAAAYSRAQATASANVSPVYLDKLNQYLDKARLARTQTEQQTDINKQNIATGLTQTLQDTATNRVRTDEDTRNTLADLKASEAFDQQQGGTQFDRARTALLQSEGQYGGSGLVAQQEDQAIQDRNATEAEQTRQYTKQREATNTLANRTFEDLGKSETRAKGEAQGKTQSEDINLKNFIDNQAVDETSFRTGNEADRLAAIANDTNNQYNVGVAQFISGLIGGGARAQDIALAQQVYG